VGAQEAVGGPGEGPVRLIVNVTPDAYERIWTAAAAEGLSRTDVVSRALILYDAVLACGVFTTMSFERGDGSVRSMLIVK
jgi:hypothetical protein